MMRSIIIAAVMFISGLVFGQSTTIELRAEVRDDDNGKALSGAIIEVYKNGALFASETSASSGKVPAISLPVCIGCTYKIKIKKPGYVTKTAIVDGHTDYPEEMPPGTVVQKFEVGIFESVEGIDFAFLENEPMVEFAIDSYGIVGYDEQKIKVMQKKIADLRKKMVEKKAEIEKAEAEKAKREADFNAYVEAGDAAVKLKEYEKAIGQYELALGIKPDDQPTKDKIQNAKIKLEELRANEQLDKDFSAKMQQGKTAYSANELEKALGFYKEASGLKPAEQLPKDLIAEIEKKLADQKNGEAAFNKLVAEGDAASGADKFDEAIAKYDAALKLKKDSAVETKLADVKKRKLEKENALANEKANQLKYDQLLAKADGEFDTEKYEAARLNYEEALKLKPNEAKPKDKIAAIDKILKERADQQAANQKKEADYQKLMTEGKEKFDQRKWPEAKAKYEAALVLKPNDSQALSQIDLINKEAQKEAGEAKLNEEYNRFMTEAKALLDQKKYQEAKAKYNQAAGVKPLETEPKNKIAEIDRILADTQKAEELEAKYKAFMTEGDGAADRKDYATALDRYKKAIELKPGDSAAQSKIDAINKAVADANKLKEDQAKFDGFVATAKEAFNAKDYDKAKLNYNNALGVKDDAGIRTKIKEIDDLIAKNQSEAQTKAKFEAAMKEADELYRKNDYPAALEKYTAALSIKEDDLAKQKIAELKTKISANEAAQAKEKQFTDLVAEGNAAYDAKEYGKALAKFKEAIQVKPDPAITKKIGEIDVLIAAENQNTEKRARYDKKIAEAEAAFADENWNGSRSLFQEAAQILPSESYPNEKIAEIEKRMAAESAEETEREYQKIVAKADELFKGDKLDEAKTYYDRAISIKPSDSYTKTQLDKIAAIKKERADALSAEKRVNEQYDALIKEGERASDASNWQLALEKFNEALKLKPSEAYPKSKIAEIESKMGAAELEKQKEAQYTAALAKADKLFNEKDYLSAISAYKEALALKPNEKYPTDKISSAENFLKLETANEVEQAYKKMLEAAQKKMDEKDYSGALDLFLRAKTTKPSDPLPQQRIDEINQILAQKSANDVLETKYKDLIKEADYQYEKGNWKNARDNYESAFNLFNREWPEKRIKECEGFMKNETATEENKSYDKMIKKADEYFGVADYVKAKELYERALGIKPSDQYPKDKLAEIQNILNPQTFANSKPNLTNYGNPNRSTNAVDVESMLTNAEEQRKFISAEKTAQLSVDAANAEGIKSNDQLDYSHQTHDNVEVLTEDLTKAELEAGLALNEAVLKTNEMELDLASIQGERGTGNENNVQLQNQGVNNIQVELEEVTADSDVPREEYLADMEAIKLEIALETGLQTADQTNAVHNQKDYLSEVEENRIEADPNMDVARKNTEVRVEDYNIQIINKGNGDVWAQEDMVMFIKDETEVLISEQIASTVNSDIPREEGVENIEEASQDLIYIDGTRADNQYDVSIEQKKYTEGVINEILDENSLNDKPRERMEDFTENQNLENGEVMEELTLSQNDVLFQADTKLEALEIDMDEKKSADDLAREGYEKVIENVTETTTDFVGESAADGETEGFRTEHYLQGEITEQRNATQNADKKADDNIDKTADAVSEFIDEKDEMADKSRVDLENSEDRVESLRDIKINEITPEVKNALGAQFPEGMTEEVYTINDEDGLMISYIVRRIVVRNEEGNVYEKVQTKFGTTSYTCNGAGITEYQWQDETEASDLVRN